MLSRLIGSSSSLLLIFFGLIPVLASAAPKARIVADENGVGCSDLDTFKEHRLKIVVNDGNKLVAEKDICSSYGAAEIYGRKGCQGDLFSFA